MGGVEAERQIFPKGVHGEMLVFFGNLSSISYFRLLSLVTLMATKVRSGKSLV